MQQTGLTDARSSKLLGQRMVRITLRIDPLTAECVLRVEGSLVGPWVDELQLAVANTIAAHPNLRIDLQQVQFVDTRGFVLLRSLQSQSTTLHPLSPFVREMLLERKL